MIIFDVNQMIEANLSPRLRKAFTMEFLKMVMSPLVVSYAQFYQYVNEKEYELIFNGQVIYMEHLLNDQFDNINRGIYITDAPQQQNQVTFFNENENNEETVIYNESEGEQPIVVYNYDEVISWPDFIVNVPASVVFDENRLKGYLNKYKLGGKNYKIKIV